MCCCEAYLKTIPLCIPLRIQRLAANVRLESCISKFDFYVGIGRIARPIHNWQIPTCQYLYLHFPRHGSPRRKRRWIYKLDLGPTHCEKHWENHNL